MYKLKLSDVTLKVYLGVYDFEQVSMQEVRLDLTIMYHQAPKACTSDQLKDTQCYAQINACLEETAVKKRYQLIEHLAQSLLDGMIKLMDHPVDIYLELHKKPPLENVGLASFCVEQLCIR